MLGQSIVGLCDVIESIVLLANVTLTKKNVPGKRRFEEEMVEKLNFCVFSSFIFVGLRFCSQFCRLKMEWKSIVIAQCKDDFERFHETLVF